ncbi:MAG: hypothetical protein IJ424_04320 [Oscillospiraceae bacterium]|nr:hypothetical protein [Oscillospiraceae bacterium]
MKTKIKHFIQGVVFAVLLVISINACGEFLEYKEAKEKYTDFFESETNFDVIFLGTSHTWNSVLPMELWEGYGISSYNWGYSNCTPAESYYIFKDVVKYTEPKVVVLDMFGLMEYQEGNGKYRQDRIEQQHVQFDEIPFSLNKLEAALDVFDNYDHRLDYVFNLMMYHNRWDELDERDFNVKISPEKGASMLTGLGWGTQYWPIGESQKRELDSVNYEYFIKFLDFCHEEDIPVLCVYLPFPASENNQKAANSIGDVVDKYLTAEYVNMLNLGIVDFSTDMYNDNNHLNFTGACKVTDWLGEYLTENYRLDDYSQNEFWIADHEEYVEYKAENIKNLWSLNDKLLSTYGGDFDVELVISSSNDLYSKDKYVKTFMDNLGWNGTVTYGDSEDLILDNRACEVILRIYNTDTLELVEEVGYTYFDGQLRPVK